MAVGATFEPQSAPGQTVRQSIGLLDAQQSLMQRATQAKQLEQMRAMQMEQERVLFPIKVAEAQANLKSTEASLKAKQQMEYLRGNAATVVDQANQEYIGALAIPDWQQQSNELGKLRVKYNWLANVRDEKNNQIYKGFLDTIDNARGDAAIRARMDARLGQEAGSFAKFTEELSKEDQERAKRIKLRLERGESSAAIQYREVIGPDGSKRLVAVDPNDVGAQTIGSGEVYGSGVRPTRESEARAAGKAPEAAQNPFRGPSLADAAETERVAKIKAERPKRTAAIKTAENVANRLISDLDDLIGKVTIATTGPGGALLSIIPGTAAADLEKNLNSIKATLGFQALQAIRDASPTGGALGPVSDVENKLLQQTLGNLEIGQSPAQTIENIRKVRQRVAENFGIARMAYNIDYGEGEESVKVKETVVEVSPEVEDLLKKYRK